MIFNEFSKILEKIESTTSRNEITLVLVELFRTLDPKNIKQALYMIQGRLAPKYVDLEFQFSRKLALNALEKKLSKNARDIYKEVGDVGLVAENILSSPSTGESIQVDLFSNDERKYDIKDQSLSIGEVFKNLKDLALAEGKGSMETKMDLYIQLITKVSPISARFITRIIIGSLRLGTSDKTMMDALSWLVTGDKSLRKKLDYAFGAKADIGELALIVLSTDKSKIDEVLENIKIEVGIPVAAKLVERESDSAKTWERLPNCFVQPKLDGLRGQIHKSKTGEVHIYSRNLEEMTKQFPELVRAVRDLEVDSIILDSEIIGWDKKNGEFLTYQETMTRKRKFDIDKASKIVPVRAMCFDVLFLNEKDISQELIEYRLDALETLLKEANSALQMLETRQMKSEEELDQYFSEKVEEGLEGIIVKEPKSTYEPGTRNFKWIKLKANTRADLVDTIDVAVLGYYFGRGQRAKFGIGALLAGVYDPQEDQYFSVGKVGSGITEETLEKIVKDLKKIEIAEKPENVDVTNTLRPDAWVEPKIIMEIDADEITRSPNHTAAKGIKTKLRKDDSTRGLSVRFPRLKVWDRDKDYPNTVSELVRMYELRKKDS